MTGQGISIGTNHWWKQEDIKEDMPPDKFDSFIFLFKKIVSKAGRVYENCLGLLSFKPCLKINSYPLFVRSLAYNRKLYTEGLDRKECNAGENMHWECSIYSLYTSMI